MAVHDSQANSVPRLAHRSIGSRLRSHIEGHNETQLKKMTTRLIAISVPIMLFATICSVTQVSAKPRQGVIYDMVIDTNDFPYSPTNSAPLLTKVGEGKSGGPSGWQFWTNQTVTPTDENGLKTYPIGFGPKGVIVRFNEHNGVLQNLTIDGSDADGVWHVSDVVIPSDAGILLVAGEDIDVKVNVDNIPIHRKTKNGTVIGTVAIGTIRLTAAQP